ncbi:MAG: hypothetical protein DHS20C15_15190 [Planctomycetota bacterium]|nr:MAG: hypothetical protein DHS20C15_15190 [Planctomycetota bacterium]
MDSSLGSRAGIVLFGTLWVAALCFGFRGLLDYSSAPSDPGTPVSAWPDDTELGAESGGPELLMFAHALCPCTQASLAELERVLARAPERPRARVVLWSDPTQPERFSESRLRDRVRAVPEIELVEDPGGRLACNFGVTTSGTTVLFDADGRRRFAGGITASRGHEGTSVGTLALDALLRGESTERSAAPVYGCSLTDDVERAR